MQEPSLPTNEYKTSELELHVRRKPACIVEFTVKVMPDLVRITHQQAIRAVRKEVSIPGFRKGKAPEELISKRFSKEIDKEWKQELANSLFAKCEKLANVPLLQRDSKVNFDVHDLSLENGAEYSFSFETHPLIPTIDSKAFHLTPVERSEITETQVKEAIRQILLFFASWSAVEDRGVEEGDFVLLDVNASEGGALKPLFTQTRFEVSDKSMAKWMKSLLMGQKTGAILEGESKPDEGTAEAMNGFPAKPVQLSLLEIEKATIPPLDEKLFAMLGVKDEEELTKNVKKLLQDQVENNVREEEREQTVSFLLKTYPFDLPQSLVIKEAQFRLKTLFEDKSFRSHWESLSEDNRKEFITNLGIQAEKAVRMFYLCKQIVSQENLTISLQDVPPPPSSTLELLIKSSSSLPHAHDDKLKEAESYARLTLEKGQDYLISSAKSRPLSNPEDILTSTQPNEEKTSSEAQES